LRQYLKYVHVIIDLAADAMKPSLGFTINAILVSQIILTLETKYRLAQRSPRESG
jgi:hypothetical protein